MKKLYCEKYFNNEIKPKHLCEFKEKTPKGNIIEGYIVRKSNKYLGSLVITHITQKDGKSYDTEQFVQAFPKIHYWDKEHKLKEDMGQVVYYCQEKLDGTCLIVYSLNDNLGNSIEIIPKTRSKAVADEHIIDMYNLTDKKAIEEFFKDNYHINDTLMFELFGVLNKHEISYMDTYIDITLIGACIDGFLLNYISLLAYFELENFQKAKEIFIIEKYPDESSFSVKWCGDNSRLKNYKIECEDKFPTLYDAIQEVKILLKQINENYFNDNNRRIIEGVVVNGVDSKDEQLYIKIKPSDIELEARSFDYVPRRFILKEVRKYFDEYGLQVKELYELDETHYIKYVKYRLKEEFDYEQIEDPRTRRLIKNVFMQVWDSKIPPISIQNICTQLIKENPEASITDLMKIFAKTYPSKKRQSKHVYTVLSSIKRKMNLV